MEKSLKETKVENRYLKNLIETRVRNDNNNDAPRIPRIKNEIVRAEEVVDECLEPYLYVKNVKLLAKKTIWTENLHDS